MAIEIPNFFAAGAAVTPTSPADPLQSNNGFQAFDPATDGSDPDLIVGGFTRVSAGDYYMKLEEGGDPLELAPFFTSLDADASFGASMVPYGVPAPGTLPDGRTLQIELVSLAAVPTDRAFFVAMFRYNTGPNVASQLP